jgi:hypothetical protein
VSARPRVRGACPRLASILRRELSLLGAAEARPVDCDRLELVTRLYDAAGPPPERALAAFIDTHRDALTRLYAAYRDDPRARAFAGAPEALLIFERLEHDPDGLVDLWRRHLPYDELEQFAAFYGLGV